MRLGYVAGYTPAAVSVPMREILAAESLGFESAWTSEAYGSDAVSTAAWILAQTTRIRVGTAIMQMPARTPTCAAMTAMTLNALSGGRFLLGIGPSGPRVSEGWYGVPYGRPMTRTREYIDVIRQVANRAAPLQHEGHHYQIPYHGPGASGLGEPLRTILEPQPGLRIYTAAVTPGGLRTAAAVADGVLPIWLDPDQPGLIRPYLEAGFRERAAVLPAAAFEVCPLVPVVLGDDVDACRAPVKANLALYVGGMGPRQKNFYTEYVARLGWEAEARRVQNLYLAGDKAAAAAAVPDALVDAIALVGPAGRIRDRLGAWRAAADRGDVAVMLVGGASVAALELLAKELL
jgi:F420-dependent oxidoreductase-like protein